MFAKFLLGTLKIDEEVCRALGRSPLDLIARHAVCEHGVVPPATLKQNKIALATAAAITSEYLIDPTNPSVGTVTVTTSNGWNSTAVKLKTQPKPKRKYRKLDGGNHDGFSV